MCWKLVTQKQKTEPIPILVPIPVRVKRFLGVKCCKQCHVTVTKTFQPPPIMYTENLQNLESWPEMWRLGYIVIKCKLLLINTKKRPNDFDYYLNYQHIYSTHKCDYRGVRCRRYLDFFAEL